MGTVIASRLKKGGLRQPSELTVKHVAATICALSMNADALTPTNTYAVVCQLKEYMRAGPNAGGRGYYIRGCSVFPVAWSPPVGLRGEVGEGKVWH